MMTITKPLCGRGRWLARAAVLTAVLALGLLLSRLAVPRASAEPISAGQSADDLMQEFESLCNAKGGNLDVWQTEDGSIHMSCVLPTYTAYCSYLFDGNEFYDIECWDDYVPAPGAGSQSGTYFPGPTPSRGGGSIAIGGSGVNAPPEVGAAPTPTPTQSVHRGIGVISIKPGPAQPGVQVTPTKPATGQTNSVISVFQPAPPSELAPPETGNSSGIHVTGWTCPRGVGQTLPQLVAACTVPDTIDFEVNGPVHKLIHGGIELINLPAGTYVLTEHVPANFTLSYAFCAVGPSNAPPPNLFPVTVDNGSYDVALGQNQAIYCNWFNVYAPVASPVATRPVTGAGGVAGVNNGVKQAVAPGTTPTATTPAGTPVP